MFCLFANGNGYLEGSNFLENVYGFCVVLKQGSVCVIAESTEGDLISHYNVLICFLFNADGGTSLIIDKTVPIAQLCIAHRHNLLLLRTGMGFTVAMNCYLVFMVLTQVSARTITSVFFL